MRQRHCSARWKRRSRLGLAAGGLLVLAAGSGCTRLPGPAVQQVRDAHQAYQRRQYARCEQLLDPVITRHRREPDVAEAHYVRALCRLQSGQAASARQDLEAGLAVADRPELRGLLQAQLGNLEYEAARYAQAAGHYRRARPRLPERPPTDRVLLRFGESLQRSGRFAEAKRIFAELILDYPNSAAARQARGKISPPGGAFSVQCGAYSRRQYADRAVDKLRRAGVTARVWQEQRRGVSRYVVRTGPYQTHDEASKALARIRAHVPDAFVVP